MPHSELKKLFLFLLIFTTATAYAYAPPSPFWTQEINSALEHRDSCFAKIGIADDGLRINSWDGKRREIVRGFLDSSFIDDPWYNFLKGMVNTGKPAAQRDSYFEKSLLLTENDPGTTWCLFVEFSRYQLHIWAENCLVQLEKQMLFSGCRAVPIISQQLINFGVISEKQHDPGMAQTYFAWAERFDPIQDRTILHRALMNFPFEPTRFFNAISDYWYLIRHSWPEQLSVAQSLYFWIRTVLFTFIIAVFFIFSLKYFPRALHFISDLYPLTVPPVFRLFFSSAAICSLVAFGFLPFIWLCAFLFWKHLENKDRIFCSAALILVTLAPIDMRIVDMFHQATSPGGSLNLFSRSINEGYSEELHRAAFINSKQNSSDYVSNLAVAVCELKKGDSPFASKSIAAALQSNPRDAVALALAGNLSFYNGDFEKAGFWYLKALEEDERNAEAKYNLGQCKLKRIETIAGADLIKEAAEIEPALVNTFVRKNDVYFSKNQPLTRVLMYPDYSPGYFWTNLFKHYSGSWATTTKIWGIRFLGIPPFASIFVSIVLFFLLILLNFIPISKVRRLFECKYCGRIICFKCKCGILCSVCAEQTKLISNDKLLEKFHSEITRKSWRIKYIENCIFDILFPGSGKLLEKGMDIGSIFLLFISCMFFSSFIMIILNPEVLNGFPYVKLLISVILFAYNIFFAVKRLSSLMKVFATK